MKSWLKNRLTRLWGKNVDRNIIARLAELEQDVVQLSVAARQNAENALAADARLVGLLQPIMNGLAQLDKKSAASRAAEFLAQASGLYAKKRSVLFMGRSYFGDNIKYAYLALCQIAEAKNIECHFLPYDERQFDQLTQAGLPCLPPSYDAYQASQIETLLSAKILILDEQFIPPNWKQFVLHALLRGARTVQLWHGIPLKQIGLEILPSVKIDDAGVAEIAAACGIFDVFVAASASSRPQWRQKFAFKEFAAIGYPRDDVLFRAATARDLINVDAAAFEGVQNAAAPVILYAPTFRDSGDIGWFDRAQIARVAEHCRARHYILLVNLHPGEQRHVDKLRQYYPGMRFIEPQTDIYPILKFVNLLITDYSSLAFDYILLDRPVVFYRPDHADYVTRSRPLIADAKSYLCGPVVAQAEPLIAAIEGELAAPTAYADARRSLVEKLYDHRDDKAGARLCEKIIDMLDEPA